MKKLMMTLSVLTPLSTFAQMEETTVIFEGTNFFICVVAGVLLALGFQLLLTSLSVAGGITAIGNVEKHNHKSHKKSDKHHSDEDDGMNMGQKVSSGLGAWTLITTSIALFFASLLAVKLGLVGANFIGATLGLVIWAAFFMIVTYLEVNMISSLVGGFASTVKNSLSSASSVFSTSEEGKAKKVAKVKAKQDAKEMRKQLEKLFNTHDIDKKIEDYVRELKPQHININQLKKQIKDLLTDLQVTEKADFESTDSIKKMILEEADKSTLSPEEKKAVKDHVHSLKDIAQSDATGEEKTKRGIEQLSSADRQQIDEYQEKIKKALQNTNNSELQPGKLEEDFKKILGEPKSTPDIIRAKASAIDRPTLVKLLASQNMSEEEADKRVSQAEKVLNKISSFFSDAHNKAHSQKEGLKHTHEDVMSRIKSMFGGSSVDLHQVYSDASAIFHDSGAAPDLKYRLEHYNEEEMTNMITSRTSMGRDEAAPIAKKIVAARDSVLEKAYEVEIKVREKMEEAKEKAMHAAEESRKAAATAAWWLVATAVVSGAASAVGGMLALEGWIF